MTRWLPAAALALACAGGAALAQTPPTQPLNTTTLVEFCGAAPTMSEAPATAFCRGFIIGAGQHHHAVARVAGQQPAFRMPNPGPTHQEFQAAFVAWGRANPQFGQESAVHGLVRFAAATQQRNTYQQGYNAGRSGRPAPAPAQQRAGQPHRPPPHARGRCPVTASG